MQVPNRSDVLTRRPFPVERGLQLIFQGASQQEIGKRFLLSLNYARIEKRPQVQKEYPLPWFYFDANPGNLARGGTNGGDPDAYSEKVLS